MIVNDVSTVFFSYNNDNHTFKTTGETFWFFFNSLRLFIKNLTRLNIKANITYINAIATHPAMLLSFIASIFVIITIVGSFVKKPRSKRRYNLLLNIFSVFAISVVLIATYCNNSLKLVNRDARALIYNQLLPFFIFGVWASLIYNPTYLKPLNNFKTPINSWVYTLGTFYFFIINYVPSSSVRFLFLFLFIAYCFNTCTKTIKVNKKLINITTILLFVTFLITDYIIIHNTYVNTIATVTHNGLLTYWCFLCMRTIHKHVSQKHPAVYLFFVGIIKPLILYFFAMNFTIEFAGIWILQTLSFIYIVFYVFPSTLQEYLYCPVKAYEKGRKITMFEEGPEMTPPEPVIEHIHFNSNPFRLISDLFGFISNVVVFLIIVNGRSIIDVLFVLLIFQSISVWFVFYSAYVINHTLELSSMLDWRGMFLALYHYHWPTRYTTYVNLTYVVSLLFIFTQTAYMCIINVEIFLLIKVIFMFTLCLFVYFKYTVICGNVVTFIQDNDYTVWDDDFWALLSPALRDYVCWKPIQPDDYEEPEQYYYELFSRSATRRVFYFTATYLVLLFCLVFGAFSNINLLFLFILFKMYCIHAMHSAYMLFFWYEYEWNLQGLYDYAYFEFLTFLTYALMLVAVLLYYYY